MIYIYIYIFDFRCQCSNCEVMPTEQECRCCSEIPQMRNLMERVGCSCITLHPGFEPACLNQYTLDIAYSWFNQQYREQYQTNEQVFFNEDIQKYSVHMYTRNSDTYNVSGHKYIKLYANTVYSTAYSTVLDTVYNTMKKY